MRRWPPRSTSSPVGLRQGFRSGLEEENAAHLKRHGIPVVFEQVKIKYPIPSTLHTYTPDFGLPNWIIVETKGRFMPVDRAKHLYIKITHPYLDIRFVFQNPNAKLGKGSKTTNAMWAEMHGFKWAKKLIPIEWAKEVTRGRPVEGAPSVPGPCTIAVPPEATDHFANSSRQPLPARSRQASRRVKVARPKDGSP